MANDAITNTLADPLAQIRAINQSAAFNRWCGIEVVSAEPGKAEIAMPWRAEVGQYSGFLHAGLVGALIDTACGFAAVSVVGRVLASHYSVNCLRPAVGERFIARARVVKPGKTQVFTACELYAVAEGSEKLVATGETLLSVVGA
ncbi:MAG: PaaI family thioesterase [Ramlibacter sp.]|nr:PaaI family thioesterase [Ramlibacter sp.]